MKNKVTIDQFLQEDVSEGFLCTVEIVQDDNKKVKLTAWMGEQQGCNCNLSIVVERNVIESVAQTDYSHFCCGKKHKVVEVFFKENASVKVEDWIKNISTKAAGSHVNTPQYLPGFMPSGPGLMDDLSSAPYDESTLQQTMFQSRFPPTLPSCGWRKVVCGSALPGYPVPMCWEYYCKFPGSSRNIF